MPCAENIEYRKKSNAIWGSRSEIMRVLYTFWYTLFIYICTQFYLHVYKLMTPLINLNNYLLYDF